MISAGNFYVRKRKVQTYLISAFIFLSVLAIIPLSASATIYENGTIVPGISYASNDIVVDFIVNASTESISEDPVPMYNITGIVVDDLGYSVVGAIVSLEGGSYVTTDTQGYFTISVVNGSHTLTISANEMEVRTINVVIDGADKNIDIIELTPKPVNNTSTFIVLGMGAALIAILIIFWLWRRNKENMGGRTE